MSGRSIYQAALAAAAVAALWPSLAAITPRHLPGMGTAMHPLITMEALTTTDRRWSPRSSFGRASAKTGRAASPATRDSLLGPRGRASLSAS